MGGGNKGKCRPYGRLCERPPDPGGPQLSHQHSSPDWTCLKSYIMLWIPPSSPSSLSLRGLFKLSSSSPLAPCFPLWDHNHKDRPAKKNSPEPNQFWEVIVQLLQLNTLLTSCMTWFSHECSKNEGRYICNWNDQTHRRRSDGCHWQSHSSRVLYVTCIGNPDDYSLDVFQQTQAYRDTDLWVITGPFRVYTFKHFLCEGANVYSTNRKWKAKENSLASCWKNMLILKVSIKFGAAGATKTCLG